MGMSIWSRPVRLNREGAPEYMQNSREQYPEVRSKGVVYLPVSAPMQRAAEPGGVLDSWFDRRVHRRLSRPVSALAITWGLSPNMVSVASLSLGLIGADCFAYGSAGAASVGVLLYFTSVVLDHVDGEVARLTHAESRLGALLDVWIDAIVNAGVVLGMGINARGHGFEPGVSFGFVGATGVMASTFAVKYWTPGSSRRASRALRVVLDMLADRLGFHLTLSAFVVLLALAPGSLPILMVVVALGSHAYWLARAALSRPLV
jgi:phosphatidylglycerophosphate synthase